MAVRFMRGSFDFSRVGYVFLSRRDIIFGRDNNASRAYLYLVEQKIFNNTFRGLVVLYRARAGT